MTMDRFGRRLCGQQAVCNRPAGHRGHHGGFRAVPITMAEVPGVPLAPQEMTTLRTYATHGNQKIVAAEMEVSIQTVKNNLSSAYRRLDVTGAVEAFTRMGWLRIPTDEELGFDDDRRAAADLRAQLADIVAQAEALANRVTAQLEPRDAMAYMP